MGQYGLRILVSQNERAFVGATEFPSTGTGKLTTISKPQSGLSAWCSHKPEPCPCGSTTLPAGVQQAAKPLWDPASSPGRSRTGTGMMRQPLPEQGPRKAASQVWPAPTSLGGFVQGCTTRICSLVHTIGIDCFSMRLCWRVGPWSLAPGLEIRVPPFFFHPLKQHKEPEGNKSHTKATLSSLHWNQSCDKGQCNCPSKDTWESVQKVLPPVDQEEH